MSPDPNTSWTAAEVTDLLEAFRSGDADAGDRLLPIVYQALHEIAARLMRDERADHTLQPTILLHDAWLKLTADRDSPWSDRSHFLALATRAMRRLLVDHARARQAGKRRGDLAVGLIDELVADTAPDAVDLIALDDALEALALVDHRAARVVDMRYFGGMEWSEIGPALGITDRTAKRDWQFARVWLQRQMEGLLELTDVPQRGNLSPETG